MTKNKAPMPKVSALTYLKAFGHVQLRSTWLVFLLAFVISLLIGAILIAISGANVFDAYAAMFRGAIFNYNGRNLDQALKPLSTSVFAAVPLIIGGLGLALGFRAGLFNIGGTGQLIFGAIGAAYVGFAFHLPAGIHLLVAMAAAIVAGGFYGWIAGILKARTGANEVIVTIMLNSVAGLFLNFLLTQKAFQRPGSSNPQSPMIDQTAQMPDLLPKPYTLDLGIVIALLAAVFMWWYLERSTWGYELRAVGANPHAARTAGMSIGFVTALTLAISGAYMGLAGGIQITSTMNYLDGYVAGSIGFDAITVALLGRNKPLGTVLAGLLFGAFKAGGRIMQAQAGVPIDMVLVLQSVIVLLIAAPAFVRWIFRLPAEDGKSIRTLITMQTSGPQVKEVAA